MFLVNSNVVDLNFMSGLNLFKHIIRNINEFERKQKMEDQNSFNTYHRFLLKLINFLKKLHANAAVFSYIFKRLLKNIWWVCRNPRELLVILWIVLYWFLFIIVLLRGRKKQLHLDSYFRN